MTTVTVHRIDTGETAVSISGEFLSDVTEGTLRTVTVRNQFGDQYVEVDTEQFVVRLDSDTED